MTYSWRLRQLMAEKGLWKTSELIPLLHERGVDLSLAQVYRLVANTPERLSLPTLAALCDILSCTPYDLIELRDAPPPPPRPTPVGARARPRRARVTT